MKRYRIINWKQYNSSLIQRGSLTFWVTDDVLKQWRSSYHTCRKGRPQIYSDVAILCALTLRTVYKCPLRSLQGLLSSLFEIMKLLIPVPSYTQVSRRAKRLKVQLERFSKKRITDIVLDSTGLKLFGEGEWPVRQYGASRRRTWRKLHLAIDPDTSEIVLSELTENNVSDGEIGAKMAENLPKSARRVFADGAYDGLPCRSAIHALGADPIIPPPKNARIRPESDRGIKSRNEAIREIQGLGGNNEARCMWKRLKSYHKRSLIETMMYRLKQLLGEKLRSRSWENQLTETQVKCYTMNRMTSLGLPEGIWEDVA